MNSSPGELDASRKRHRRVGREPEAYVVRPPIRLAQSANSLCGGCFNSTRTSVAVSGRYFPERRYHGTPSQRHESMNRRRAQKVSTSESLGHVRLLPVAGVLAPHHVIGLQRAHGFEDFGLLVVHCSKVPARGRLHGQQRDNLKEMVLDHVAQASGGFVKRAALSHAEISQRA